MITKTIAILSRQVLVARWIELHVEQEKS